MKFARYQDQDGGHYGIVEGDTVYAAEGDPFSGTLSKGSSVGTLDDVQLLIPVDPGKIVAIGFNYAAHIGEIEPTGSLPTEPIIFMKPTSTLLPQDGVIELPPANRIDHEAELAIVIGKEAHHVSEEDAPSYILGYTCGNDVSHRDYQRTDGQWIRAKGFDTFCPLGPVVETELDPSDLSILARLNGEVKQSSRTSNLIFNPAFLVSFISDVMTLNPGDVIMTGTPEGVSPMKPGDTIEVEIEGIGTLRNTTKARD